MSIIYKLTFSLFALTLIVFGIYGTYQLRTESQDLRDDVEQETRVLIHSLLVSVENALRDQQTEDVQELLQQIEHFKPSIDVRIYIQNRSVIRSGAESLVWPEEVKRALYQAALDGETKQFYFPTNDPDFLVMSLPFNKASTAKSGNLAVVRSLQKMKEDLSKTKTYILWSFFSLILFITLLCFFLGQVYISRPLQELRQAMLAFRNSREPPEPLPVTGSDELSSVRQEFNRMTAELFSAYRRLDTETQQRRQLQRALQNADKMITIGQLSAGLAHEIGSPLQIINGRARALAGGGEDLKEMQRIANILVDQTDRITRIVQRLLEFAPRPSSEPVLCDVIRAVAEVIDMLGFEARRQGVTMTFTHTETLPLLLVNKDGIQQIVLNLLSNALAAIIDTGSITVDLSHDSIVYADNKIPALRLTVSDTGTGIAPEHLPYLFEPYFTTRSKQGGTGLGLAVVKTLITEMGGSVVAETEFGKGSQFIVHLPWKNPS
ncbi:sensor histidine kinase [Methylobacter sp. YRD-M1]|uniref:sensor histidine kinase n=1 Tax=Methylobacter sp. YRD-M1 TaxID=2911520 RepID=UPI00227D181E|nr:ATP-binding protein [Methylobacter sp. YRD-M1]WAK00461.1 ATP-binding protein [Methylobacter sp. YRD-M1]